MNVQPRPFAERLHVSNHPLILSMLTRLRDLNTGPEEFRRLVAKISTLLVMEATKDLELSAVSITTPMAEEVTGCALAKDVALVPIWRAGLGMLEGIRDFLPQAKLLFLGLQRNEKTLRPETYYQNLPEKPVARCLILDPMLATGGSADFACGLLKHWGAREIRFIGIIGAPEGVDRLLCTHPDVPIFLAAEDRCLNTEGFILPGLGDAGDRQFGT